MDLCIGRFRAMRHIRHVYGNTWSLMDDAIELIRDAPMSTLATYYIGSMPFIFIAVSFFFRAGNSAKAGVLLPVYSLILALAYIWMKTWHSIYAWKLSDHLHESHTLHLSAGLLFRLAIRQTIIQGTSLLLMPLGLITTVPFGYLHAFYQTASVKDRGRNQSMKELIDESRHSASRFVKQNHFIIWMLSPSLLILAIVFFLIIMPVMTVLGPDWSIAMTGIYAVLLAILMIPLNPLGIIIFLNIASIFLVLPSLLNTFLGIDSMFTQNPSGMFTTTFFALVTGLTIMVMEPVMKSAYVLRIFYIDSLKTGDDIRASLKRLIRKSAGAAVVLAFILMVAYPGYAQIDPDRLEREIRQEVTHSRYEWVPPSLPDDLQQADPVERFLFNLFDSMQDWFKSFFNWLRDFLQRFWRWDNRSTLPEASALGQISYQLRVVIVVILICLTALICRQVVLFLRKRKATPSESPDTGDPGEPAVDISSESTFAFDLPTDEWLRMAEDMATRGEFRLALRALYLSILAWLGDARYISLSHSKSNRDYRWELMRHTGPDSTLTDLYNRMTKLYEAVWYGSAQADKDMLQILKTARQALVSNES